MEMHEYIAHDYWSWAGKAPRHFPSLTVTFNIEGLAGGNPQAALDALDAWHDATGMDFVRSFRADANIIFNDFGHNAETRSIVSHGLIVQSFVNVGLGFDHHKHGFAHEIGHALGLGHPGPYNLSANPPTIFPDDTMDQSVMSYLWGILEIPTGPREDDVAAWNLIYDHDINVPTFERPSDALLGDTLIGGSGGVDGDWYLYRNQDVRLANADPDQHYREWGWREGRDPNAYFDTSYYLELNTDVAAAGIDPLLHYNEWGWKEGRNASEKFDTNAYLKASPDVDAADVNPLEHYMVFGLTEGRPSWLVV